jgi:hypothetical protein
MLSLISDDMRSIVGKTLETRVSYPVSASDIRRWVLAVYYPETPPRRYWDENHAAASPYGGIVAPDEFNVFAWGARSRDYAVPPADGVANVSAPEQRIGIKPPDYRHVLNGGLEHRYTEVKIRPGDVITSTSAIVDYEEREGRLGLMLFTTLESRWVNQHAELVTTQRITMIRY